MESKRTTVRHQSMWKVWLGTLFALVLVGLTIAGNVLVYGWGWRVLVLVYIGLVLTTVGLLRIVAYRLQDRGITSAVMPWDCLSQAPRGSDAHLLALLYTGLIVALMLLSVPFLVAVLLGWPS